MNRFGSILVVLLLVPSLAGAQRGGGSRGGGGIGRGDTGAGQPEIPTLSKKDIEKFNIVALLLDEGKDLKLSSQQRASLDTLSKQQAWNIAKLGARIDSAQTAFRSAPEPGGRGGRDGSSDGAGARGGWESRDGGGPPPRPSLEQMRARRQLIQDAVAELIRGREAALAQAFDLLSEPQRAKATKPVRRRDTEILRKLQETGYADFGQRGAQTPTSQ